LYTPLLIVLLLCYSVLYTMSVYLLSRCILSPVQCILYYSVDTVYMLPFFTLLACVLIASPLFTYSTVRALFTHYSTTRLCACRMIPPSWQLCMESGLPCWPWGALAAGPTLFTADMVWEHSHLEDVVLGIAAMPGPMLTTTWLMLCAISTGFGLTLASSSCESTRSSAGTEQYPWHASGAPVVHHMLCAISTGLVHTLAASACECSSNTAVPVVRQGYASGAQPCAPRANPVQPCVSACKSALACKPVSCVHPPLCAGSALQGLPAGPGGPAGVCPSCTEEVCAFVKVDGREQVGRDQRARHKPDCHVCGQRLVFHAILRVSRKRVPLTLAEQNSRDNRTVLHRAVLF